MQHKEGKFRTSDNLCLFEQCWIPNDNPKAVVIIVHGSFEHSSRYSGVAEYLVYHNYKVFTFDLRGHGRSEGERAFVNSFDVLVRDVKDFLLNIFRREGSIPTFMLGHSVGGTILVLFVLTHQPQIQGLILSAPALKLNKGVPWVIRFGSPILGFLLPKLKLSKLDSRFLSRDPEVIASFEKDPLIYREGLYAGAVAEFIRAVKRIQRKMEEIKLPLLILHGTRDLLSDIEGSYHLYQRAKSNDKTLKLYENFYHELFQEPEKEKVFDDILLWLNTHTERR